MGRVRVLRTLKEQLEHNERRRAQKRKYARLCRERRRLSIASVEQQTTIIGMQRSYEDEREERRQQRRERDAQRKRAARSNDSQREAENAARKRRRVEKKLQKERREDFAGVLLSRCPCGQVVNTNSANQAPGWEVRREVSTQCGLQEMPPLPLPLKIFRSVMSEDSAEEGKSGNQTRRLSQVFYLFEKGNGHDTGKVVKSRQLYECHVCQYSTPKLSSFRSHLISHSLAKPFKCEVCAAAFKCLGSYKAHMCKHTGEEPYQCELCPYSTAYKKNYTEHCRTHLNSMPLACTLCAYRCNSSSNLCRHRQEHSANCSKPFKCKVCHLCFGRKHYLNVHMQQHKS